MQFKTTIPVSEFKEYKLKVLSLVPIEVSVYNHDGQAVETFQTESTNNYYTFQTAPENIKEVICDVIPGMVYEFHPVVQAI